MQKEPFLDSDAAETLYALSIRYYLHEMYTESLNLLEYLLRHEPADARYHCAKGKAQQALSLHMVALQSYTHAIKLGIGDADVHFYCGQCLIFLRRYESARDALALALGLAQRQPQKFPAIIGQARELLTRITALLSRNAPSVSGHPASAT